MILKNTFDALDNLIKRWYQIDPQRESRRFAIRDEIRDIKSIFYDMDVVDSKSSALLTHISVMFVVLGVLLSSKNHWIVNLSLSIELIAYVVVASFLLRSLDISASPFKSISQDDEQDAEKSKAFYHIEIAIRRATFAQSLRITYILTILLIPIILLKYAL